MKIFRHWGICLLLVVGAGCAQTAMQMGTNALKHGNYDLAESHFREALAANPQDWQARRGLGLAYYERGEYVKAAQELETVRQQMPADGQTSLYLGLSRERLDDFAAAEQVYSRYVALDNSSKLARRVRGRLLFVKNEKARQQVQQAIQFDQPLIVNAGDARVVGVLPFIPVGDDAERLDPLAVGLAALVVDDLFRVGSIKLVERMQLKYILDELALAGDSVVDVSSAPRLNRLIGAGYLVRGDLVSLDAGQVGIHSGVINTRKKTYNPVIDSEEKFSRLWSLQKQITFAIIDSLGITLTPEERNAISRVPTENYEAFLAYCNGIAEKDQGNYDAAGEYFNRAAVADPNFGQAAEMQEESKLLAESGGSQDEFENTLGPQIGGETPGTGGDTDITGEFDDLTETVVDNNDTVPVDDVTEETGTVSVGGTIR